MAAVARSLGRTAFSIARQTTATWQPSRCSCPIAPQSRRPFSVTPFLFADNHDRDLDPTPAPASASDSASTSADPVVDAQSGDSVESEQPGTQPPEDDSYLDPQILREIDQDVKAIQKQIPLKFGAGKPRLGFWGEDEDDDFAKVEDDDDEFKDDAITSMAHAELHQHRHLRKYARITAWDMPSLSALAKPFSLPPQTHILRFRYTTYMGETHPAESKVVVELCSKDLTPTYLTEAQRITFLKLVGPRYNPDTDIIRMSSEKFPSRAQNKRYLGDLVEKLLTEAKEGDSFADIPLDLRHHKPKKRLKFPAEWAMTEERKEELSAMREEEEKRRIEQGKVKVVDGNEVVAIAVRTLPALSEASLRGAAGAGQKVPVGVKAGRGRPPQKTRSTW
ncbi:37S ribosomal protein S24, mitochondrial [Emydomyces testavorans]|uniref:37S ribosomal protein S24, mitochondrial n=1 Tax=Emydomyces testavorans TaxID=2070801 RepID=A0AAF0DHH7_9EURO|nr:37S ribosomal protein S24, mitochondrial [Emydomyces testavorans]